ncbi:hypothetical protein D3C76_1056820 [compost metagenome]
MPLSPARQMNIKQRTCHCYGVFQAGLRTHERDIPRPHAFPDPYRPSGHCATLHSFTVAGAAPESRALHAHRLPCFTPATRKVAEHLKHAAKVRGLGVERQLKPGRRAGISTGAQYSDANLVPRPQQQYQRATNPHHNNKGEPHARHDHQQSKAWYFPYAYRKLRNEAGHYHPGIAVLLKEAHG